jgi:hypothetical protein
MSAMSGGGVARHSDRHERQSLSGSQTPLLWRARYRDDAGKEHARHFPRKIEAQRWLDEVTARVVTGQYVDPAAGRATFAA